MIITLTLTLSRPYHHSICCDKRLWRLWIDPKAHLSVVLLLLTQCAPGRVSSERLGYCPTRRPTRLACDVVDSRALSHPIFDIPRPWRTTPVCFVGGRLRGGRWVVAYVSRHNTSHNAKEGQEILIHHTMLMFRPYTLVRLLHLSRNSVKDLTRYT